jgi:hypothetical protein
MVLYTVSLQHNTPHTHYIPHVHVVRVRVHTRILQHTTSLSHTHTHSHTYYIPHLHVVLVWVGIKSLLLQLPEGVLPVLHVLGGIQVFLLGLVVLQLLLICVCERVCV